MIPSIETNRLLLRALVPSDDIGLFELDSDPEVHRYLGNKPVTDILQCRTVIANIRQQYVDNGVGRWAVILKETGEFIGWAGLKLERNVNGYQHFYDVGYRLIQRYCGNGYATEAAMASIQFGFEKLKVEIIYGCTLEENNASCHALEKCGLKYVNTFDYNGESALWYEIRNPAI